MSSSPRRSASAASAASAPDSSSAFVPGNISPEDKRLIHKVFLMLQRTEQDAAEDTSLKVIDSLRSRFIFQVCHPKDVDSVLMRNLKLKIPSLKSMTFDLQNSAVNIECWRSNCSARRRGAKRRRDADDVDYLPENVEAALQSAANNNKTDLAMLQQIMLWIVNREERFCMFDITARFNSAAGVYTLSLEHFERVRLDFVRDLETQWKAFVQNVVFDWGSRSLVLNISK